MSRVNVHFNGQVTRSELTKVLLPIIDGADASATLQVNGHSETLGKAAAIEEATVGSFDFHDTGEIASGVSFALALSQTELPIQQIRIFNDAQIA